MYALGVDLGTTWTAAALWRDGVAETVGLGNRAHTVPSTVLAGADGRVLVGEAAERQAPAAPERVAREFKRGFGDDLGHLLDGELRSARWLTARVLEWVLAAVTEREGAPPDRVTVTVPATWQDFRTELMAGLAIEVLVDAGLPASAAATLPEPAAAAIYYAGRQPLEPGTTVGVYDLGGGTFDATVVRKTGQGFEIVGLPVGSDHVGGIDVDHALLRRVTATLGAPFTALDRTEPAVRSGLVLLRQAVVEAKEALSTEVEVAVPVLLPGCPPEVRLTRHELEEDVEATIEGTVDVFRQAVDLAGLTVAELDAVLLVGGSSRIPLVRRMLDRELGRPIAVDTHPKFAVCLGAAIAAGATLPAARPAPPPPPAPLVPAAPDLPPLRPGMLPEVPPPPAPAPPPVPIPAPAPSFGTAPGPDAPAPSATGVAMLVDLVATGLTDAAEVPLRPAAEARQRRRAEATAAPLVVRLGEDSGYAGAARRGALLTLLLVALMAGVLTLLVFFPLA